MIMGLIIAAVQALINTCIEHFALRSLPVGVGKSYSLQRERVYKIENRIFILNKA